MSECIKSGLIFLPNWPSHLYPWMSLGDEVYSNLKVIFLASGPLFLSDILGFALPTFCLIFFTHRSQWISFILPDPSQKMCNGFDSLTPRREPDKRSTRCLHSDVSIRNIWIPITSGSPTGSSEKTFEVIISFLHKNEGPENQLDNSTVTHLSFSL